MLVPQDGMAGKMNSLARSNASLYGNKEELYDRLRRHAYQGGKKGELVWSSSWQCVIRNQDDLTKCYPFAEKSAHETTSDSDDGRHA